ncbi:NAD-dependent epimerase/dehydratase family protein [Geminicoccus roseus]|uniref:NAD-dependent epimerase/dehydratase family protein n=1 Tax=Geminicoccus roseus TaxID=404900 RepID=UPI000413E822|nr:NAD-dependent epimerase/dehydratase family protein [Geminicoccus roseus]
MTDTPPRRALVTGATGFTGWYVAKELLAQGFQVRALVRDPAKGGELVQAGMEVVSGDLRDAASLKQAVEGCTHVFHIGALYREARFADSVYFDVNVTGTGHLFEAALQQGARVVHCSTVGVHGDIEGIADENAPIAPGDVYQESKVQGEELFQDYLRRGMIGACFRPAGIYGPRDTRFLKLFRTIRDRKFRMFGSGEILYHLTYVEDLARGIVLLGTHPAAIGETFILTGARYTTLNELVALTAEAVKVPPPKGRLPIAPLLVAAAACEALCKPFGIEPPLHRRRTDFFTKSRAFTSAKAERLVGYAPVVDLREGLGRTAQWYFEQGLLK